MNDQTLSTCQDIRLSQKGGSEINIITSIMRRVAFIHPDLGIGGAERLVVDAALGLVATGNYTVEIFTSHHDPSRCFPETQDGSLSVRVLGNSIIPPSFGGRFVIICAILRQLHLTLSLALSILLHHIFPRSPSSYLVQNGWIMQPFDVIVVDQLSASIPLLRWLLATRVLFYCHFPDLLLSPGANLSAIPGSSSATRTSPSTLSSILRLLYRIPFNAIEHSTTGQADKVVVNSIFTRGVFHKTFPELAFPEVLYPAIDTSRFIPISADSDTITTPNTFLSINRYENKKQHSLALEAFAGLVSKYDSSETPLRLIIAGGYDERIMDNLLTLDSLQKLATSLNLNFKTYYGTDSEPDNLENQPQSVTKRLQHEVIFVKNLSDQHKIQWMGSPRFAALLYTAQNEHLGIVPLEAMSCGLPVIACNNGGPVETIADIPTADYGEKGTGLLRPANPEVWSIAMMQILNFNRDQRATIRNSCVERAKHMFSLDTMTEQLANHLESIIALDSSPKSSSSIYSETSFLKFITAVGLSVVFASLSFFILYTTH